MGDNTCVASSKSRHQRILRVIKGLREYSTFKVGAFWRSSKHPMDFPQCFVMVNRLNEKGLIRLERKRKEILKWRSSTHPKEANNFFSRFPPFPRFSNFPFSVRTSKIWFDWFFWINVQKLYSWLKSFSITFVSATFVTGWPLSRGTYSKITYFKEPVGSRSIYLHAGLIHPEMQSWSFPKVP